MTRELVDAPSSYGVDLTAEASLVDAPDLRRLARKVQRGIERRRFVDGAAAGALVAFAAVGAVAGAHAALTHEAPPVSCPACLCASAADVVDDAPQSTDTQAAPSTPERPAVVLATPPAAPKKRAAPTKHDAADVGGLALEDAKTAVHVDEEKRAEAERREAEERSRLRTELALYDAASHALARGELDAAQSAAQTLRTRYPDGPLAIEAGIVAVTALRDGGHRDDARALLVALTHDPRSHARARDLAALAKSLGSVDVAEAAGDDDARPIAKPARIDDDAHAAPNADNQVIERTPSAGDAKEEP